MKLARFTDNEGQLVAVNPEHVVAMRQFDPENGRRPITFVDLSTGDVVRLPMTIDDVTERLSAASFDTVEAAHAPR